MILKGILDFSLGNFLCLRGFAPMGDLYYDISEADGEGSRHRRFLSNRLRQVAQDSDFDHRRPVRWEKAADALA